MLVALFSLLIALLFGGNEMDYYMVSSLDKGMNKCIIDKGAKQEVKKLIKEGQKETKAYYKVRKQNIKELNSLLSNKNTSTLQFEAFETMQLKELTKYQDLVFDTRIACLQYVSKTEWDCIIESAEKTTIKKKKKSAKKTLNNPLNKVRKSIEREITSAQNKEHLLKSLNKLENSYKELLGALQKKNEIDQKIIRKYDSTTDDFKIIASEVNTLRSDAFNLLVQFHHDASPLTNSKQWQSIAKQLNKSIVN